MEPKPHKWRCKTDLRLHIVINTTHSLTVTHTYTWIVVECSVFIPRPELSIRGTGLQATQIPPIPPPTHSHKYTHTQLHTLPLCVRFISIWISRISIFNNAISVKSVKQLKINSWWKALYNNSPGRSSGSGVVDSYGGGPLIEVLSRNLFYSQLGVCLSRGLPERWPVTKAGDVWVQRSGSLWLHFLSRIGWRTAVFVPFLSKNTWKETGFQVRGHGLVSQNLALLGHSTRLRIFF